MTEDYYEYEGSRLIVNTHQYNEYNLYFNGPIVNPDSYYEDYAVFKQATPDDIIRLWLNSEGGDIGITETYISHMRECQAPIIGVIGVNVASACSAIALECDEIQVTELSTMLVHSFQYGTGGTESKVYNQALFNKKLNERWLRRHFEGFLTEEQMEDALRGVDVILDAEGIVEAWNNLQEHREFMAELEADEKEQSEHFLEEDEDILHIKAICDQIKKDPEFGMQIAIKAGIIDEEGNLTEWYR